MRIAITGANGFIGRALTGRLLVAGHDVLPIKMRENPSAPQCDAVVHLAGEPVAQRWNAQVKRRIFESRVDGTRRLVRSLGRLVTPPPTLVAASAVGYYGSRGDETLTEQSLPGADFLAGVCREWEVAQNEARALGVRVVNLRIGMVLGHGGGALVRMVPAFKLGVGGKLGDGRQWVSWIHLDDIAGLIEFALATPEIRGPVNAVAPLPATNATFARTLASVLHRPAFVSAPAFALKMMVGEMSAILLASQRALPRAANAAGFKFTYPELRAALEAAV